jgi:HD-GYP domain-containing protein (c-di-GMP phosphodiesterase class II)
MNQLKRISVNELTIGMYFCGFDGPWIDTPFWRNKFLIRKASEVAEASAAGYEFCWIDPSQGQDVDVVEIDSEPEIAQDAPTAPTPDDAFQTELREAMRIFEDAKKSTQVMFKQARLGKALDIARCQHLVDEITASLARNSNAFLSVIRLKMKDEYTYLHSIAVCTMMVALGRTLGMDDISCKEAGLAGYLHDVGKAFIPVEILNKPDKLTDQEYRIIQRHPHLGYEYLRSSSSVPDYAADVCLHHHEKIDGSGYPDKHRGNQISVYSRMAAICDVYDAVTSERPYKAGWDPAESVAKMATWAGHFDRAIYLAFVKTLGIYPIGSIVKLNSGRTALVIRQNHENLTKPVVKAFTTTLSIDVVESEIIDLSDVTQGDFIMERSGQDWLKPQSLIEEHLSGLDAQSDTAPGTQA